MAYQESSYGPRSTYAGPTNNAPHFPHSHQQLPPHHFYHSPNPYPPPPPPPTPHDNHPSNHPNATSPPLPSYLHSQPSEGQAYHPQRLPYGPNHSHNGGGPLMQPPMSLPDDHFKKPYLPQQQYINHGLLLFPCPLSPPWQAQAFGRNNEDGCC